jgi:hypothetical protein
MYKAETVIRDDNLDAITRSFLADPREAYRKKWKPGPKFKGVEYPNHYYFRYELERQDLPVGKIVGRAEIQDQTEKKHNLIIILVWDGARVQAMTRQEYREIYGQTKTR